MIKIIRSFSGNLSMFLEKTYLISNNSITRFMQTFFTISSIMVTILCIASLKILGLEKSLEGTACFTTLAIISSTQHIIYYFRQNEIKQLLDVLLRLRKQHRAKWEKEMYEKYSNDTWNAVYRYCVMLIAYMTIYLMLPTIMDIIIGNILPDSPSLRVDLPCEGFITFFEPRTAGSFAATIPVLLWCCEALMQHAGSETLIFVSIMYTKTELAIIKHKLSLIKTIANEKENNYHTIIEKLLREVILQYQMALKALENINNTLGLPIVAQNIVISMCLCFTFYGIVTINEKGGLSGKLNGLATASCIGALFFSLCYFGESLEEENNEVFNSIYDLPWYYENQNFREMLIIMLRQAHKPFFISYRLTAKLNLHTFMQVINTSYSCFMMLKSTI